MLHVPARNWKQEKKISLTYQGVWLQTQLFLVFFLFHIAEFDEDRRLDLIREEILKHRQEVLEQEKKLDSLLALLDPNVSDYSDMDAET